MSAREVDAKGKLAKEKEGSWRPRQEDVWEYLGIAKQFLVVPADVPLYGAKSGVEKEVMKMGRGHYAGN